MAVGQDKEYSDSATALTTRLTNIIVSDPWSLSVLKDVRALSLPDWAVGAGFVRNLVWDKLSNKPNRSPLADVDVLYFENNKSSDQDEIEIVTALNLSRPDIPWSVKNQARMHVRNGDPCYADTNDALTYWLETVTCVAVRLEENDELTVMAPYGLEDLFSMNVHPTPSRRRKLGEYRSRMKKKNWPHIWPHVCVSGT